ncbi:hypothetical protein, partial [Streptomyces sp. NPDC005568]|uniref:hypothetical protein n=1 Tax=Streptomyces sp. NPDC005568 TaxID=3156887 RepID=UPI0033B4DB08
MRSTQIFLRSGLTVAAAAALPLTLSAGSAAAWGAGISVSTSGSTVTVTTSACTGSGGSFGNASLLTSSQSSFAQGRQAALTGTSNSQMASWSGVRSGTYTVIVVCQNGTTAADRQHTGALLTGVPQCHQGVHGLAGLRDGDH